MALTEDPFLTVAEIAEFLKLNPQTIRNWIEQGSLAATRVGARRVRVRQSELDRFLEANTHTGRAADQQEAADEQLAAGDQAELRELLGDALADASRAITEPDNAATIEALRNTARAADRLADELAESQPSATRR